MNVVGLGRRKDQLAQEQEELDGKRRKRKGGQVDEVTGNFIMKNCNQCLCHFTLKGRLGANGMHKVIFVCYESYHEIQFTHHHNYPFQVTLVLFGGGRVGFVCFGAMH